MAFSAEIERRLVSFEAAGFLLSAWEDWERRARNGGALSGAPAMDKEATVAYLIDTQYQEGTGSVEGCWCGDNRSAPTFDEGAHGSALALLGLALQAAIEAPATRSGRTTRAAFDLAVDAVRRCQYRLEGNGTWSWWGGLMPQSPGHADGQAKFPVIAGFGTVNDQATLATMGGMISAARLSATGPRLPDQVRACVVESAVCALRLIDRAGGPVALQVHRRMETMAGRSHEPDAYSTDATAFTVEAALQGWALTGDQAFIDGVLPALEWLQEMRSATCPDYWPHFVIPAVEVPTRVRRPMLLGSRGEWAAVWGNQGLRVFDPEEAAAWPGKAKLATGQEIRVGTLNPGRLLRRILVLGVAEGLGWGR